LPNSFTFFFFPLGAVQLFSSLIEVGAHKSHP
jgi:hypothetical protein